ncbi:hypothetical protein FHR90_002713 [Endobacter medicaginis]|uniref:Peptidase C39-like domain-containing protein n=2 Tax=Endobacter medicaginis TaxID=1181271 RepID=A0A839UYL0_9PROT|nr:hypothetical protein [Endobacter medicaginis]MBB3174866.1 hypothetical protein [Endobacter medicaginis]MCX5475602.1 hypothetical protein [Endobacter medicaginis]
MPPARGRLGRRAPPPGTPAPRLARYLRAAPPPAPARLDRATGIGWRMFCNDRLGCCTIAALANAIVQRTQLGGGTPLVMDDATVEHCYGIVGGYVPGRPETDAGAVETDVLGWFAREGVRLRPQGVECGVWARLAAGDREAIRQAVQLFGSAYLGLDLPRRAQTQTVWEPVAGDDALDRPGSWGGHAVLVAGYDEAEVSLITWGGVQKASWAFLDRYCDEAYAVFAPGEWLGPRGTSPGDLDFATLAGDLRALGQVGAHQ